MGDDDADDELWNNPDYREDDAPVKEPTKKRRRSLEPTGSDDKPVDGKRKGNDEGKTEDDSLPAAQGEPRTDTDAEGAKKKKKKKERVPRRWREGRRKRR